MEHWETAPIEATMFVVPNGRVKAPVSAIICACGGLSCVAATAEGLAPPSSGRVCS